MRCELWPSKSRALSLLGFRLLLVSLVAALAIVACGGNGDAESHLEQGRAYYEDGSFEQAIDELDAAIRLDPEMAEAYSGRGSSYFGLGEYDRAIADFEEAIRLDPELEVAYLEGV